MDELYKNKYRIKSARAEWWDYSNEGAYFITICTKNRVHFFGNVIAKEMQLSETGKLAEQYWYEIPEHFPFIQLGNFVVMPNHVHGILIISKPNETQTENEENPSNLIEDTKKVGGFAGNKNPMLHDNISRVVRWYKGRCSFEIRKIQPDFAWLPRFHDHIIRNIDAFNNIQAYILNNPLKWKEDTFFG